MASGKQLQVLHGEGEGKHPISQEKEIKSKIVNKEDVNSPLVLLAIR